MSKSLAELRKDEKEKQEKKIIPAKKEEKIEEETKIKKQEEEAKKKEQLELKKQREIIKKKQEEEETRKEQIDTDLTSLKTKNQTLENEIGQLKNQIDEFKDLTEELTKEAEKDFETSKDLGQFNELKKTIKNLNVSNKSLLDLYDKKTKAYRSEKEKPFQLEVNKIRKAITQNYNHIPNWDKLAKEDKIKLSPETYGRIQTQEGHTIDDLQVVINRIYSGRISYLKKYVYIINKHFNECVRDEDLGRIKLDPLTLEIVKELLLQSTNSGI